MSCVHNGLLNPELLDEYKKTYMKDSLAKLEEVGDGVDISEGDVSFAEEESDE